MAKFTGGLIMTFACVALLHAAFSTYEHFSRLKALGKSEEGIRQVPNDIILELAAAVVVFAIGVTLYSPPLKDITWASEMRGRTIDEMDSRASFAGFNHRGPAIFSAQLEQKE